MSRLTPIVKICTYNKPCEDAKMQKAKGLGKNHQKTILYKHCEWQGTSRSKWMFIRQEKHSEGMKNE